MLPTPSLKPEQTTHFSAVAVGKNGARVSCCYDLLLTTNRGCAQVLWRSSSLGWKGNPLSCDVKATSSFKNMPHLLAFGLYR